MNKLLQVRGLSLGLAIAVVILDQWSKHLILSQIPQSSQVIVIPGVLDLRLVWNNGAAFSLFPQGADQLGLISFAVALFLILWLWRAGKKWQFLQLCAAGWLLGGSIGNGLDRWRLGAVVDFIEFVPINFPVFNFADIAINLAVVSLLLHNLRSTK